MHEHTYVGRTAVEANRKDVRVPQSVDQPIVEPAWPGTSVRRELTKIDGIGVLTAVAHDPIRINLRATLGPRRPSPASPIGQDRAKRDRQEGELLRSRRTRAREPECFSADNALQATSHGSTPAEG
jgi:hypothetical protein